MSNANASAKAGAGRLAGGVRTPTGSYAHGINAEAAAKSTVKIFRRTGTAGRLSARAGMYEDSKRTGNSWGHNYTYTAKGFRGARLRIDLFGKTLVNKTQSSINYTKRIPGKAAAEGRATARLDTDVGYLIGVESRRRVQAELSVLGAIVTHEQRIKAELATQTVRRLADLPEFDWDGTTWSPVSGAGEAAERENHSTRDHFAKLLEGATLQSLIDDIRQLMRAEPADEMALFMAREKLAWMVRMNPEMLTKLDPMLRDMPQEVDVVGLALAAVGSTQMPESAAMLGEFFADANLGEDTRMNAAFSMFQLEEPNQNVVEMVREMHRKGTGSADLDSANLMLLGQVAGKKAGAAAMEQLIGAEPSEDDLVAIESWLLALGNSASPSILPTLEKYLRHGAHEIRQVAVGALRGILTPAIDELLAKYAAGDPSASVRSEAISHLDARKQALQSIAAKDSDRTLRQLAIELLERK